MSGDADGAATNAASETDSATTDDTASEIDAAEQRRAVRERYADIATDAAAACCDDDAAGDSSCCDTETADDPDAASQLLGYDDSDVDAVAAGANLGLGCGNPTALAGLEAGETVLDLGSGGGFDCFLAAREVGPEGSVIGVDMTPEMVERARANVDRNDADNVEFRLGEIEHLPVADATVDVILSNCVINLSPEKPQVFREAFRVLQPGGRLAVSDVVRTAPFPADVRLDPSSVTACVAGASSIDEVESMLEDAGFIDVAIAPKAESEEFIREWDGERDPSEYVVSATIEARKPA
jgi:SAM-dependent methyltransferase